MGYQRVVYERNELVPPHRPGVFLFVMGPMPDAQATELAQSVSEYDYWRPNPGAPEGSQEFVHRGVGWAVVVRQVDNEGQQTGQTYVVAAAFDPLHDHYRSIMAHTDAGQAGPCFKGGISVAMGHNGPL